MYTRTMLSGLVPVLLIGLLAGPAAAQEFGRRAAVAVVLTDEPPVRGQLYTVERRPEHSPYDVIYLTRAASAVALSDGIRTVMAARAKEGPIPSEHLLLTLAGLGKAERPATLPWAQGVVDDLRAAEPGSIAGIEGELPVVIIWLPTYGR